MTNKDYDDDDDDDDDMFKYAVFDIKATYRPNC